MPDERKPALETLDWDGLMERVMPMLPQGAVVLSADQLEGVRELLRQVEQLYALGPMQGGPFYATSGMCRAIASVHALLAAKDGTT